MAANGQVWRGPGVGVAELGAFRASAALLFFNLLDGVFTTSFLQLRLAEEVNPLMRWAYAGSPVAFMAVKLLAVQAGVFLLWRHRRVAAAQWAVTAGATLYGALVAWHLAFLVRLALS